jgi:hypothetical protein
LKTWVAKKTYTINSGDTVKDLLERVLKDNNMSASNPTGDYVESITKNGVTLAEFTNGTYSGWMDTINGEHPNVGISHQVLKDGDDVIFHYTDLYARESKDTSKVDQFLAASVSKEKIDCGDTATITAKGVGKISYSSSDENIVTVSKTGVITTKGVGKATVTVKAAGNSEYNSAEKDFKITVIGTEISSCSISLSSDSCIYNGKEQKIGVTVKDGKTALVEGTDYTLSYSNNVNAGGDAKVVIKGKKKYTGSVTKYFEIQKAKQEFTISIPSTSIVVDKTAQLKVEAIGDIYYMSSDEEVVTVNPTGLLTANMVGNAIITVQVEESNNYKKTEKSFQIFVVEKESDAVRINLSKCKVSLSKNKYVYSGKAKNPTVTVNYGQITLVKDRDYSVSYSDNKNVGMAKVVITGKGNYTGSTTLSFSITQALNTVSVSKSKFSLNAKTSAQNVQIKATKTGGSFAYTSSDKKVTVSKSGKVKIPKNYVGKVIITVSAGNNNYKTAKAKVTVTVTLRGTKLSSVTNTKGQKMTVKWSKNANVAGYEIQYSTDKNFKKSVKSVSVSKVGTVSTTVSGLKKGSTYYVRIRTQIGKNYSDWSASKTVKISK